MSHYFTNKKIWLTGASSGIGYALAKQLSEQGTILALSGRNESALQKLQTELNNKSILIPFDVTDKEANIHAAKKINEELGGIDMVILNAGMSQYHNIKNFKSEVFEKLIRVNYLSVLYGIEASLPFLRQSKAPHIIGMCSIASYGGLPGGSAYGASKAALRNMLEGLRIDLAPEKIPVSIICPGFIKTPLTDNHAFHMPFMISADFAAKKIIRGIEKQQHEINFPKIMSWTFKLGSSLPSVIYNWIMVKLAPERMK